MPLLHAERKSTCRNDGRAGRCDDRYLEGVGGRSISDAIGDQEKVGENEDLGREATFVRKDTYSHDVGSQSESEADGRKRHSEFECESENVSVESAESTDAVTHAQHTDHQRRRGHERAEPPPVGGKAGSGDQRNRPHDCGPQRL